jgi:hypothetical protein
MTLITQFADSIEAGHRVFFRVIRVFRGSIRQQTIGNRIPDTCYRMKHESQDARKMSATSRPRPKRERTPENRV